MPSARLRLAVITVVFFLIGTVLFYHPTAVNSESVASLIKDTKSAALSFYDGSYQDPPLVPTTPQELAPHATSTFETLGHSTTSSAVAAKTSEPPPSQEIEDWTGVDVNQLPEHYRYNDIENVHRKVSSVSTTDGKYFLIDFINSEGYNPNIIPHHTLNDTYIVVAQHREHSVEASVYWAEIVCTATFVGDTLRCLKEPLILPIAATFGEGLQCPNEMGWTKLAVGPHDARVFYGPQRPYVIYGSNSEHPCLGQWIQDFRLLMDWGFSLDGWDLFKSGTEMQRPDAWGYMEKNWFVFWDKEDEMYVHHDIYPKRVFSKLNRDGTVGPDLAPAAKDEACMAAFMPSKARVLEGIHQATNSLSITLCKRSDPACVPKDDNTFIFTIFQHKSFYAFHGNYEPFVMVFQQTAPFSIFGISSKPIFINGRTRPGDVRPKWMSDAHYGQTEMFYVTSMSWKAKGQTYHGFLDDHLFLSFGIEDAMNAGIDIVAGDLFLDLNLCAKA